MLLRGWRGGGGGKRRRRRRRKRQKKGKKLVVMARSMPRMGWPKQRRGGRWLKAAEAATQLRQDSTLVAIGGGGIIALARCAMASASLQRTQPRAVAAPAADTARPSLAVVGDATARGSASAMTATNPAPVAPATRRARRARRARPRGVRPEIRTAQGGALSAWSEHSRQDARSGEAPAGGHA